MQLNSDLPSDCSDDLIKPPGSVKSPSPEVVTALNGNPTPDRQIKEEEFKKLEEFDIRIQTVQDGISKVNSLSEVEGMILGQESVNQLWAKEVDSSFGKFFDSLAFESFSITPTKTNYRPTVKFMRERIAMEHIAVNETFSLYHESLGEMLVVLSEIENRYLGAAQLKSAGIRNFIQEHGMKIVESKKFQVNYDGAYCNLGEIDLTMFDANKLLDFAHDMIGTMDNLKIILNSGIVKSVILGALASKSLYESLQHDSMSEFHGAPISLNDMIELYGNGVMDNILEQLHNDLPVYISRIEKLKTKAEALIEEGIDFEKINVYIMDHTQDISEVKSYFNKSISFMNKIIEFFINSEMMFEYMSGEA